MNEELQSAMERTEPGRLQLTLRPRELHKRLQPEYSIDRFPASIGRHPTNDIELPFESVSRYHARVELHNGQPRVVDLRSSNGSWVNGRSVQVADLHDQDSVAFGDIEFTILVHESALGPVNAHGQAHDLSSVHFVLDASVDHAVVRAQLHDDTGGIPGLESGGANIDLEGLRRQLRTFYRLQDILRTSTEEKRLLRRVLDLLFDVLPVERGVILLRDTQDAAVFRPVAIKTCDDLKGQRIGISRTILQRCLHDKVAILSRDAPSDGPSNASDSVVEHRMHSLVCAPFMSARRIFGFCHLDTSDIVRGFGEEDLTFLASLASEVAVHLHNLRMIEEKIQSERMAAIGQTITGMAHSIKNILVLTEGGIEMMEKRLGEKRYDSLDETWSMVRRGLGRMSVLAKDMLDYSKSRTVQKKRTDVNELLTELHETYADEFDKRRINCHLKLDDRAPRMMLDAEGMNKALDNLLINAMESVQQGVGEIWLTSAVDDEENLIIEVIDNGMGIPKEVLPRIFAPFFTTRSAGSGLGLAMTRKIVEDMGGRIDVTSKEGKGSCFSITLQVHPSSNRLTIRDAERSTRH